MYRLFISCGETSGDRYAAELLTTLQTINPNVQAFGNGGDYMKQAGVKIIEDVIQHSTIGFIEPILKVPYFLWLLKKTKEFIQKNQIKTVLIIDHQGFNIPLAKWCKKNHIQVVAFIAPQFWMWGNKKSAIQFIKTCKMVACIFKQEYEYYQKIDEKKVVWVGHPLVGQLPIRQKKNDLIGVFPGSRKQEISHLLPLMLDSVVTLQKAYPNLKIKIAVASTKAKEWIMPILEARPCDIELSTDSRQLMSEAMVSIVASGTVTLEHAIVGTPCVVVYKLSPVSYWLAKQCVLKKIQNNCHGFIALPNILAKKQICPEWLQEDAKKENIVDCVKAWLDHPKEVGEVEYEFKQIRNQLQEDTKPLKRLAMQLHAIMAEQ